MFGVGLYMTLPDPLGERLTYPPGAFVRANPVAAVSTKTSVQVQSSLPASFTSQRGVIDTVSLKLIPCWRMMLDPKIPVEGLVFLYEKSPAAGATKIRGFERFA